MDEWVDGWVATLQERKESLKPLRKENSLKENSL
jgi:hypothetical protein